MFSARLNIYLLLLGQPGKVEDFEFQNYTLSKSSGGVDYNYENIY